MGWIGWLASGAKKLAGWASKGMHWVGNILRGGHHAIQDTAVHAGENIGKHVGTAIAETKGRDFVRHTEGVRQAAERMPEPPRMPGAWVD